MESNKNDKKKFFYKTWINNLSESLALSSNVKYE